MRTSSVFSAPSRRCRWNWLSRLFLKPTLPGLMRYFVERLGAGRMIRQQLVADVMEIADQGRGDAALRSSSRICGTAAAASSRSTVIRTISEPHVKAPRPAPPCPRHRRVSVLVSTAPQSAAPPPTATLPTMMPGIKARVMVGNGAVGGGAPICGAVDDQHATADVAGTVAQVAALSTCGSEMVRSRWIATRPQRGAAYPRRTAQARHHHALDRRFPFTSATSVGGSSGLRRGARQIPHSSGNVGFKNKRDSQFTDIVEWLKYGKTVRIGANGFARSGIVDQADDDKNALLAEPKDVRAVTREAMVQSALLSAARAEEIGLPKNRMILSAKVSAVQDLIAVYQTLPNVRITPSISAFTEAGMGSKGIVASSAALGILLQQGIGDTVRISLTPEPGGDRTLEVQVAQNCCRPWASAPSCRWSRMPGLRPHHLDHVPGIGAQHPGFHQG